MGIACNAGWMAAQGAFNEFQGHHYWNLPQWYGVGSYAVGEVIGVGVDALLTQFLDESESTLKWLMGRSINLIAKLWVTNRLIEYKHPDWFKGIDGSEFIATRITTLVPVLAIDFALYQTDTTRQDVCSALSLQG